MTKSQRLTRQKTAILETLRSVESHPTAEWIYQECRKKVPGLSLGTVYRNLNQLRDNGEITELTFGNGQSRFDGRKDKDKHYHFFCTQCEKLVDLHLPLIKTIESKAKSVADCMITGHRLEFHGICSDCKFSEA